MLARIHDALKNRRSFIVRRRDSARHRVLACTFTVFSMNSLDLPTNPKAVKNPTRFRSGIAKVETFFDSTNLFGKKFIQKISPKCPERAQEANFQWIRCKNFFYIIPPAGIAGAAGSFSGMSTMPHSVVRNIPDTEAAFSKATLATLVGSMTPASNRLTNSSVRAL